MRAATVAVTLSLVFASVPAIADDRRELAAELMGMQQGSKQNFDMGMQEMEEGLRAQLDQEQLDTGKPTCTKDALANVWRTEMNWKVLQSKTTAIYAEEFTEDELEDLIDFFKSDVGRMFLAKMPRVNARMQQVNQELFQAGLSKLQTAVEKCRTGAKGEGKR